MVGSVVRLKAGVQLTGLGMSRLQPGELATINSFANMDGEIFLTRRRDGVLIIWSGSCSSSYTQTEYENDFELAPAADLPRDEAKVAAEHRGAEQWDWNIKRNFLAACGYET